MNFIVRLLIHILLSAGVFYLIDNYLFGETFTIVGQGPERYLIVAVLFGLSNILIKPVLKLLLLPVKVLTLGLAGLAVNGILLAIIAYLLQMFGSASALIEVESWVTYLFVGMVLSLANAVVNWFD